MAIRTSKQVSQATYAELQAHLEQNQYFRDPETRIPNATTLGELRHNYLIDQVRSELRDRRCSTTLEFDH